MWSAMLADTCWAAVPAGTAGVNGEHHSCPTSKDCLRQELVRCTKASALLFEPHMMPHLSGDSDVLHLALSIVNGVNSGLGRKQRGNPRPARGRADKGNVRTCARLYVGARLI